MSSKNSWTTVRFGAGLLAIVAVFADRQANGQNAQFNERGDGYVSVSDTGCDTGYSDCGAGCDVGCGCGTGPWAHCTSVFAEFLYLHPTGVDMAHAQQQNGIGGAGTVPWGRVGTVDPHHEPGGRFGVNYAFDACSSIALTYTHFESDAVDRVVPPIIPGGGGAVGSLVQHPGAGITASFGPVNAWYDIDFKLVDLDYRSIFHVGDAYWLNYSVGVRYAHINQDFAQLGPFGPGTAGAIGTRTDIDFDGAGLKLGVDGERLVGNRGFSVYGKAAVSPMVGQFGSRYSMANTTGNVLLADAYWKDDRFVTMLEYEVGVAWTSYNGCWRLSLGYMANFWYNAVTTPDFVNAVQTTNYVDLGDTISFDGITARVERRW